MSKILKFSSREAVEEQAMAWLLRLDRADLSAAGRAELLAWVDADPRHRAMLIELAALWGEMDALDVLARLFPEPAPAAAEPPAAPRRRPWRGFAAVAACLLLGVALAVAVRPGWFGGGAPAELVYRTERGQQSTTTLQDGSVLTLNTESEARVQFGRRERKVVLTKGEAHFAVARNPQLPFVVYAGKGAVRAIGTAFSVRLDRDEVDVMVAEGVVGVVADTLDGGRHAPLQLQRGGIASYRDAIDSHGYLDADALAQKLAWTDGKWVFRGESLAQVIAEANRYSPRAIEITNPRIADIRIGGQFRLGDVDGLLQALEAAFAIRVARGESSIQLSALADPVAPAP